MECGRDRSPRPGERGMAANGETESFVPFMLQRSTTLLRDTPQQVEKQKDPFNDWGGGCNKFVPIWGGNGTKIAPTSDIFYQPPGQMQ